MNKFFKIFLVLMVLVVGNRSEFFAATSNNDQRQQLEDMFNKFKGNLLAEEKLEKEAFKLYKKTGDDSLFRKIACNQYFKAFGLLDFDTAGNFSEQQIKDMLRVKYSDQGIESDTWADFEKEIERRKGSYEVVFQLEQRAEQSAKFDEQLKIRIQEQKKTREAILARTKAIEDSLKEHLAQQKKVDDDRKIQQEAQRIEKKKADDIREAQEKQQRIVDDQKKKEEWDKQDIEDARSQKIFFTVVIAGGGLWYYKHYCDKLYKKVVADVKASNELTPQEKKAEIKRLAGSKYKPSFLG